MTDMGRPGCPAETWSTRSVQESNSCRMLLTAAVSIIPRSADAGVGRQLAKGRSREGEKTSMLAVISIVMMRDMICCISFINYSVRKLTVGTTEQVGLPILSYFMKRKQVERWSGKFEANYWSTLWNKRWENNSSKNWCAFQNVQSEIIKLQRNGLHLIAV